VFKIIILSFLSLFLCACVSSQNQALANIDMQIGLDDLAVHDYVASKSELLQALQLDQDDAYVQAAWGYYLSMVGDFNNADLAYQKALSLAPDDAQIKDDYAVFLYRSGDYADALKYFVMVAQDEHYVYSALAYQNASLAAKQLGNVQLAQIYASEARKQGFQ
jgi:type IV pilus assembly protein PilF